MLRLCENGTLDKDYYRSFAANGYVWGGLDDGYHMFAKESVERFKRGLYYNILLLEEDLTPENFELMTKHNLTRVKGFDNTK